MKRNENKTARRMQTFAICGCLCLLALGAGVTYRAFDRGQAQPPAEESRPVTMAKTLPLDAALLERQKRSNDAGETPDTNPTEQPAKQPAQQSQQQEHCKLHYPGDTVKEFGYILLLRDIGLIGNNHGGDVDCHESVSMEEGCQAVCKKAGTHDEYAHQSIVVKLNL